MYVDWRPSSEPEPLIKTSGGKAMDMNQQAVAAMRAITISREYGSGGGEIAARLARRLGWQLIDHAVIEQTARELGVYETEVEKHDEEYVESTLSRILNRIQPASSGGFSPSGPAFFASPARTEETRAYQETLRHIITAAATTGHGVLVGRGGQARCAACARGGPAGATCRLCRPP